MFTVLGDALYRRSHRRQTIVLINTLGGEYLVVKRAAFSANCRSLHFRVSAGGKQRRTPTPAALSIVLKFMVVAQVSVFFGKWENTGPGAWQPSTQLTSAPTLVSTPLHESIVIRRARDFAIISSATSNETSSRKLLSPRVSL